MRANNQTPSDNAKVPAVLEAIVAAAWHEDTHHAHLPADPET